MIFFGEQIEIRIDRRFVFLFFCGAFVWTLLVFFLGMSLTKEGCQRPVEQGLASLGWLDRQALAAQALQRCNEKQADVLETHSPSSKAPRSSRSPEVPRLTEGKTSLPPKTAATSEPPSPLPPSKTPVPPADPKKDSLSPVSAKPSQPAKAPKADASESSPGSPLVPRETSEGSGEPKEIPKPKEELVEWKKATHTLLVSAHKDIAPLVKLRRLLQGKGYKPLLSPYDHPKQGKIYHLTVGSFPDLSSAMHFGRKFREREAIVGRIKSLQ